MRNGAGYQALGSVPYAAGQVVHVRVVANVATHTYSVYAKPGSGTEKLPAQGYAFRSQQATVPALDTWVVTQNAAAGSLQACNFVLTTG